MKTARELMRKKERSVLSASQLTTDEDLERTYADIASGALTSTGMMRTSDDDAEAAAVELLVSSGRVEGSRWNGWRDYKPMWQDLRISK